MKDTMKSGYDGIMDKMMEKMKTEVMAMMMMGGYPPQPSP